MLNPEVIDYLSERLIAFCESRQIRYAATMISNGTCWPEQAVEAVSFVQRNSIKQVQFTFDGLAANHNKRRRYLDRHTGLSSFDVLTRTVSALLGHVKMPLRINCDPGNVSDAFRLIDFFVEQGWLYPGSGVFPYVARIRPATEACEFINNFNVEGSEFNKLENEIRRYIARFMDPADVALRSYPQAVKVLCDAMNPNGLMIVPDGYLYKCTEDIGFHKMSHGHIRDKLREAAKTSPFAILPSNGNCGTAAHNYDAFDPFAQPTCSSCKYLPQCMSGCPKQQLEKHRINQNRANIDAFKRYWDDCLGSLVVMYADATLGNRTEGAATESFQDQMEQLRQEIRA